MQTLLGHDVCGLNITCSNPLNLVIQCLCGNVGFCNIRELNMAKSERLW